MSCYPPIFLGCLVRDDSQTQFNIICMQYLDNCNIDYVNCTFRDYLKAEKGLALVLCPRNRPCAVLPPIFLGSIYYLKAVTDIAYVLCQIFMYIESVRSLARDGIYIYIEPVHRLARDVMYIYIEPVRSLARDGINKISEADIRLVRDVTYKFLEADIRLVRDVTYKISEPESTSKFSEADIRLSKDVTYIFSEADIRLPKGVTYNFYEADIRIPKDVTYIFSEVDIRPVRDVTYNFYEPVTKKMVMGPVRDKKAEIQREAGKSKYLRQKHRKNSGGARDRDVLTIKTAKIGGILVGKVFARKILARKWKIVRKKYVRTYVVRRSGAAMVKRGRHHRKVVTVKEDTYEPIRMRGGGASSINSGSESEADSEESDEMWSNAEQNFSMAREAERSETYTGAATAYQKGSTHNIKGSTQTISGQKLQEDINSGQKDENSVMVRSDPIQERHLARGGQQKLISSPALVQ